MPEIKIVSSVTAKRIMRIAKKYNFSKYLEIGVDKGETFFFVKLPHKTAVDPEFKFIYENHLSPQSFYYPIPSDQFFEQFPALRHTEPYACEDNFHWDIVFIDGLHTFEQSYRDFENVIPYLHDKSIIILDDTLPSDPWSAIPDLKKSLAYRHASGILDLNWHGDVYKTVVAIHDFHPEFSYVTQISNGNPQTILWKTPQPVKRTPLKNNIEEIKHMSYFDLLDDLYILLPIKDSMLLDMIYTSVRPEDYKYRITMDFKKLVIPHFHHIQ